jgi:hypothetical protein
MVSFFKKIISDSSLARKNVLYQLYYFWTGGSIMTDYAKLYARLCGAIDEVLDELGTIPEARHARERLQAAILDAEAQYLDTEEEKKPAGDA